MPATLLPLQEEDFLNYCVLKIAMTKSNSQRRIMQITMYAFECIILRKNQCVGTPRVIHKLHLSINPGQKIDAKISKQTSKYINGLIYVDTSCNLKLQRLRMQILSFALVSTKVPVK